MSRVTERLLGHWLSVEAQEGSPSSESRFDTLPKSNLVYAAGVNEIIIRRRFQKLTTILHFVRICMHYLSPWNKFEGLNRLGGSVMRWECIILNGSGLI